MKTEVGSFKIYKVVYHILFQFFSFSSWDSRKSEDYFFGSEMTLNYRMIVERYPKSNKILEQYREYLYFLEFFNFLFYCKTHT